MSTTVSLILLTKYIVILFTPFPLLCVSFTNYILQVLTDCIHLSGLVDEKVILLFTQFVAQAKCNAAAGQRRAPWTA